jgi:hypothetical protein
MTSFSSPRETALGLVPRLTSSKEDGTPYKRFPDVENEIARALSYPRAEWLRMVEGRGRLSRETLVFLIRQLSDSDRDLCGRLIQELCKSVVRIAQEWARGFDRITTDELLLKVEIEIIELVLAETPSRQSEFLEIAFADAVKKRTINAVDKRKNSPMPLRMQSGGDPGSDKIEIENRAEQVPDEDPTPEQLAEQQENKVRLRELIGKAGAAVKDPRHLEAVILHHVRDWPLTSKDQSTPTLARHFGMSGRQIQNWINNALAVMRTAIGEKK